MPTISAFFVVVVVVQSLSHVRLFVTSWTIAHQASLSFTISQSLHKLMSIESVMPSNHLIFCQPLLLLPSIFPCIRVFLNELALCIRWHQSIGASAPSSVLPMNIQGWFPLGLTGLISLRLRDSQESSEASEFKSVNSLALSLLYGPTLTSVHDYWKNHSFDFTDLCQQSDYGRVDEKVSKLLSANLRPKVQKLEASVKDEKNM